MNVHPSALLRLTPTVVPAYHGACWICGDVDDHGGRPHAEVLGDGLTRRRVVELVNGAGGRQVTCTCGAGFIRRVVAHLCGPGMPGPIYGPPECSSESHQAELVAAAAAAAADRSEAVLEDAIARGVINP